MRRWIPWGAILLVARRAEAHETGSIRGSVLDDDEAAIGRVDLVLHGPGLAGERRTRAGEDGRFRFELVAPGTYELDAVSGGKVIVHVEVHVALLTTTVVDLRAEGDVFLPSIDPDSAAFSRTFREEELHVLPYRSYRDVLLTVPGVAGRVDTIHGGPGRGAPSARGEGAEGNNAFIDGFGMRDPATEGFGRGVIHDAIESMHVYTDGAPAEFGQFTGMFVDIVTKDGGDEHDGDLALYYQQHAWLDSTYMLYDWRATTEVPTSKARFRTPSIAWNAGGPLVAERLWYFASVEADHTWSWDGAPVGEPDPTSTESDGGAAFAKLTWLPHRAVALRYSFDGSTRLQPDVDASPVVAPEATRDRVDWSQAHLLAASFTPDERNAVELRLGLTNTNLDLVPSSRDVAEPSRRSDDGVLHDNAEAFDRVDRNRFGGSMVYTRLLDRFAGTHPLRAGVEGVVVQDQREVLYTGQVSFPWIDTGGQPGEPRDVGTQYSGGPGTFGEHFPCVAPDGSDCSSILHPLNVGELGNTIHTWGGFVQDRWQPGRWLTVEVGARMDFERGFSNEGEPVLDGPLTLLQPRLGLAVDPFADGRTRFNVHVGRYGDIGGVDLWKWSNTTSPDGYVRLVNDGGGDYQWWATQEPTLVPLPYDDDLVAPRLDKIIVGAEREIVGDLVAGVRGIVSWTSGLAEDVNSDFSWPYLVTNPPIERRDYRALELTVSRSLDERWSLFAAYSLQQSRGHTPGQTEGAVGSHDLYDDEIGPYLDDVADPSARAQLAETSEYTLEGLEGLGWYDPDDPGEYDEAGWYGYLPYHSFHSLKVDGSHTTGFGSTLGVVYELDSGHAWQRRTYVPFYGFVGFGEGRGSRHLPAAHYLDVHAAQRIGLGLERSLEVTLDVLNLPGFAQSVTRVEIDAVGFGSTLYRQAPRSVRVGLRGSY